MEYRYEFVTTKAELIMTNLEALLSVRDSREYSDLRGVEYLYHEVQKNNVLDQVLRKFPHDKAVANLIRNQVVKYDLLPDGWINSVVQEVNNLISLIPNNTFAELTHAKQASVDFESDEVFKLNGELNKVFRRIADQSLDAYERAFLRDFFYGVDFTHWVKWAILLYYTEVEIMLPVLLRARRHGVGFSIRGDALIYSPPEDFDARLLYMSRR